MILLSDQTSSSIDKCKYTCYYEEGGVMRSYSSREVIKMLEADGWMLARVNGSHYHYVHRFKKGIVTVKHPDRDIPIGTIKSIERQSGLRFP